MAKVLQHRRGTTEEHASFTGAEGEFTYDTTAKRVIVHDGTTAGGIPMAKKSEVEEVANSLDPRILDAASQTDIIEAVTGATAGAIASADIDALAAEVAAVKTNYLPLTGGTITGDLVLAIGYVVKNTSNTGWTRIYGGTELANGGRIQFAGKDCSGYEGQVWIVPNNGTNAPALKLFPNGDATWNGKDVVCVTAWSDSTRWYRKYSDGFIEQGGIADFSSKPTSGTITFATAFSSAPRVVASPMVTAIAEFGISAVTNTSFSWIANSAGKFHAVQFFACGY